MKKVWILVFPALLFALLTTGCYTKLYRPGMETTSRFGPEDQLYDRDDSTAIDTTLVEPEYQPDYSTYDGWYNWGRPMTPRWGFDWWGYTPGYYYGYYGYNDYYGTPWWYGYYDPWYRPYYPGGPIVPGEPPSKRQGRRHTERGGGGGAYTDPGTPGGSGSQPTYSPPPSNPPAPAKKDPPPPKKDDNDSNKRSGRRGR